jgi:hypothetical protein
MRYIVRAVKYFIYYFLILALVLAVLLAFHLVEGGIDGIFRDGWGSVGKIAIMFALVAAAYPYFGFKKYGIVIPGAYEEIRPKLVKYLEDKGYELESEEQENLTFRLRNRFNRATRMWEDRVSLTRDFHGFYIEGPNRDIVRLKAGLEYLFRENPDA